MQLFDSWAGALPEPAFERWVIVPTRRIVAALKSRFPDCPVIGFPRSRRSSVRTLCCGNRGRRDRRSIPRSRSAMRATHCSRCHRSGQSRSGAAAGRRRGPRSGGGRASPHARRRALRLQSRAWRAAGNPARERRASSRETARPPDIACEWRRVAVVLMNLGGPDSLEAVRPFLFNLFSDPAIIRLPALLRLPLARLIAWRRAGVAREIYRRLGGASPLLANTEAQARALEAALGTGSSLFRGDALLASDKRRNGKRAWRSWAPDEIVCLPLYPQFSTTTTASSLASWRDAARFRRLDQPDALDLSAIPVTQVLSKRLPALIEPVLDRGRRGHRQAAATAAHGTRSAEENRAGRGPLPRPSRIDRCRSHGAARSSRARLAAMLSEPRRTA